MCTIRRSIGTNPSINVSMNDVLKYNGKPDLSKTQIGRASVGFPEEKVALLAYNNNRVVGCKLEEYVLYGANSFAPYH